MSRAGMPPNELAVRLVRRSYRSAGNVSPGPYRMTPFLSARGIGASR